MEKVVRRKSSDHERNLVERFFSEHKRLAKKFSGRNGEYLGEVWEAVDKAARGYNESKGDFVHYAVKAISREVRRAANKDKLILLPEKASGVRERLRECVDYDNIGSIDASPEDDDDGPGAGTCVPVSTSSSPEISARCREIDEIVQESLTPNLRDVLVLSIQGHTTREIASRLGENPNTIRSRLVRARRRLEQDPRMAEYRRAFSAKGVPPLEKVVGFFWLNVVYCSLMFTAPKP
jgi:RNA polymerase sigma factor (sigma-70 family)